MYARACVSTVAALALAATAGCLVGAAGPPGGSRLSQAQVRQQLWAEPLAFEPVSSGVRGGVRFMGHAAGYAALVRPDGVTLLPEAGQRAALRHDRAPALSMRLEGARPGPATAEQPLPGVVNYLLGSDPLRWRTGVPTYSRVRVRNAYPGIDAVYYGSGRRLEYDLEVAPGVDPGQARVAFTGAAKGSLNADGSLLVQTGAGTLRQEPPVAYQERGGMRRAVRCRYRLEAPGRGPGVRVSFALGDYDPKRRLVIDPTLTYCTRIGGTDRDNAIGVAVSAVGNAYVTGSTFSTDLPVSPSALQRRYAGAGDAYVACYRPTASGLTSRAFITYFGGKGTDSGNAIGVDFRGNVYVAGYTASPDFPGAAPAAIDGFVASLTPDGRRIRYATLLGGRLYDYALGLAVDPSGNAYAAGETSSTDFPVSGAFQPGSGGKKDGFACRLDSGGSLTYSTYLGGAKDDTAWGVAADPRGMMYVCGGTLSSSGFGSGGAFQPALHGVSDAFVTKLDTTRSGATSRVYSTYLGGAAPSPLTAADVAHGIALDGAGNAYVAGTTNCTDFPLLNPVQAAPGKGSEAFVSVLDPTGQHLLFSTFLGGSSGDDAYAIAVQGLDRVWVTGFTASDDFPGADPSGRQPANEAWIAWLDLSLPQPAIHFCTYLGGDENDGGRGIAIAPDGSGYACGVAGDSDGTFPTSAGAFQHGDANGGSGFLAVFTTLLPSTPTNLVATPLLQTIVRLDWSGVNAAALAVQVERKPGLNEQPGWGIIGHVGGQQNQANDFDALPGHAYAYRVRALSFDGPSGYSNEARATTPPDAPPAPTGLTVLRFHPSGRKVTLGWTDGTTDLSNNEDSFEIQRRPNAEGTDDFGTVGTVGRDRTVFLDDRVVPVSVYRYRVRAKNVTGVSDWTPELTVNTPVEKFSIGGALTAAVPGDPTPQPVVDARVRISNASGHWDSESNLSGNYLVEGLEPGTYTVRPALEGLRFFSRQVTVGPSRFDVDFNANVQIPDITVLEPGAGIVGGPRVSFKIKIDQPGAFSWRALLDSDVVRRGNGNGSTQVNFAESLRAGAHRLRVIAEGVAGGPVESQLSFQVDADAPRVELFYPPAAPRGITSPVQFRGDVLETGPAASRLPTTWSLKVDNTPIGSETTRVGPQAILAIRELSVGSHEVVVEAKDGAGHVTRVRRTIRVASLNGPAGLLKFTPPDARLDGRNVRVNHPVELDLELQNIGLGPVDWEHDLPDTLGLPPLPFWKVNQGQQRHLEPGESWTFRVFFLYPDRLGVHIGAFHLTTTDPSLPRLDATLRVKMIP